MKKTAFLTMVILLTALTSFLMASNDEREGNWQRQWEGKTGKLFLFQKCDDSLVDSTNYDSSGCPLPGNGPWPIFLDNHRWGQMVYNLMGDKFKFSFEGKRLLPNKDYTLIYYPDPWPGEGLVCLGSRMTNPAGNLSIHGMKQILNEEGVPVGLPASASLDANYNPSGSSGAVGAKIWLVPSEDVDCTGVTPQMIAWNPKAYLFEANLIVYQYTQPSPDDHENGHQDNHPRTGRIMFGK